jgi:hypothetical protein
MQEERTDSDCQSDTCFSDEVPDPELIKEPGEKQLSLPNGFRVQARSRHKLHRHFHGSLRP